MTNLKPPIFLIGNVRSGTSMTHSFFGQHPEICTWNEPRTVWCYADPRRRHDRFTADDATPRVRRYVRNRFLKFQQHHGDLRVMEKTPANVLRIPYVRAIFPESKILYIIREPLANISSAELKWREPINPRHLWHRILETPKSQLHYYAWRVLVDHYRTRVLRRKHVSVWGVRYPGINQDINEMTIEEVIAKQWSEASRIAEADLAQIDPEIVLCVRYEDFVADPVNTFDRILAHFDLRITPELVRSLEETVDPNRQSKWRRFDAEVIKRCLPYVLDEMDRHGYTPPDDVADTLAEQPEVNQPAGRKA